jgi:hypothetical protein
MAHVIIPLFPGKKSVNRILKAIYDELLPRAEPFTTIFSFLEAKFRSKFMGGKN